MRPFINMLIRLSVTAVMTLSTPSAFAQLGLPGVNLPRFPTLPDDIARPAQSRLPEPAQMTKLLQGSRMVRIRNLLRDHGDELERDPVGEPMRRGELVLISPSQAVVDAALAMGFVMLRSHELPELDLREVTMRAPNGISTADALRELRRVDVQLRADFNHLYLPSGESGDQDVATPLRTGPAPRRIGLVDGGIDRKHAAFSDVQIRSWGCNGSMVPSAHGTAVASLMVGRSAGFHGAMPGAQLFSADVYCGQPIGGSVEDVVRALAWMAREQVPVVNISLVGPANELLERAVQVMVHKGYLLVAAVGNDGPAAPALYPASYAGVVGVTGVTPKRRVLPEAAQGPQVTLAAPGSDLAVAQVGGGYVAARGTSFAAPLVAGLLAERLHRPDASAAAAALAHVEQMALDLGAPGRDPIYGAGLVGEQLRVPPESVLDYRH